MKTKILFLLLFSSFIWGCQNASTNNNTEKTVTEEVPKVIPKDTVKYEILGKWKGNDGVRQMILIKRNGDHLLVTEYEDAEPYDLADENIGSKVMTHDGKEYYYPEDPHYGFLILENGDYKAIEPNNKSVYPKLS